jgi:sodium/potassium-transporting ATPase subunit alpha
MIGFCDLKLPTEVYPSGYNFNNEEPNFPINHLRLLGLVSLMDPPRPCIKEAVSKCRSGANVIKLFTAVTYDFS